MKELILGNRVPYEYFITSGSGQSNVGSKGLPYETGSYDEALTKAGIENANVIEYTSVIPTKAKEITREEGLKRMQWGEVLECIKAQANGEKGTFISAAVMTTDVFDPNGKYLGGFACEYSGNGNKEEAEKSLEGSIAGIIEHRNFGKTPNNAGKMYKNNITNKGYKYYPGKMFVYEGLNVTEHHGTVLATICFVSYKYPDLTARTGGKKTRKH
jgi:pyruvoyl-dependent arginine decarboxylase